MDFSRNTQSQTAAPSAPSATGGGTGRKSKNDDGRLKRIGIALAGAAVIILLVALVVLLGTGAPKKQSEYVDTSKLQAVFLNTGQVYFGNIKALNDDHVVLTNIYYLQTANNTGNNNNANPNVSLVKLGCELHQPFDQMVINNDQVTFWENLGDNGQVAKAVKTFEQQNPEGQKCADQSSAASTNSGNAAQNAGSNTNDGNTNTNTTNNRANP